MGREVLRGGGEERLRDVNRFFASADSDPVAVLATLDRYHVRT